MTESTVRSGTTNDSISLRIVPERGCQDAVKILG